MSRRGGLRPAAGPARSRVGLAVGKASVRCPGLLWSRYLLKSRIATNALGLTGVRSAGTVARSWCFVSLLSTLHAVCQGVRCFPVHVRVGDLSEVLLKPLFVLSGLPVALVCLPSSWAAEASPVTSSIPEAVAFAVVLSGLL